MGTPVYVDPQDGPSDEIPFPYHTRAESEWTLENERAWIKDLSMTDRMYMLPKGPLAGKYAIELKPKWLVPKAPTDVATPDYYPQGIMRAIVRIPGKEWTLPDIVRCQYFRTTFVEVLAKTFDQATKKKGGVKPDNILLCQDEIEIIDSSQPNMGDIYWQFVEFRAEYKIQVGSESEAASLIQSTWDNMTKFKEKFKTLFEFAFKEIYILHVMQVNYAQYICFDASEQMQQYALFDAAGKGDCSKVESLLSSGGMDVNAKFTDVGFLKSLLSPQAAKEFLELGRTPLHSAAEGAGDINTMRALLDKKANVNLGDANGLAPLHIAAGKSEKSVQFLLSWNADANLEAKDRSTPLHMAAKSSSSENEEVVKALVKGKADMYKMTLDQGTALHVAVQQDQLKLLQVFKDLKFNINMPMANGNTPMHEAVMRNSPTLIQELVRLNADINTESGPANNYMTPLKMAMTRKKRRALKTLTELNAVEALDHDYSSEEEDFEPTGDGEYVPKVKGRIPMFVSAY